MNVTELSTLRQNLPVQSRFGEKQAEVKNTFRDLLMEAVENANQLDKESESITNDFIAGNTDSIHSVLIAAEKAAMSLEMIVEVRNKVLDAYNEIMRMQV